MVFVIPRVFGDGTVAFGCAGGAFIGRSSAAAGDFRMSGRRVDDPAIMRVVPKNIGPKISFFQSHVAKWAENAALLGVSEEAVAAVAALVEEARAAHRDQLQMQAATQSATLRLHNVLDRLSRAGAGVICQIRGTARVEGNGVYSLANFSAPDDPSPIGAPGKPQAMTATLLGSGWLELRWSCKNPRNATGTMYQISRQLWIDTPGPTGSQEGFEPIGLVGKRRFVDETIPPGTRTVVYKIRAFRSTARGLANTFTVDFHNTAPAGSDFIPKGGDDNGALAA